MLLLKLPLWLDLVGDGLGLVEVDLVGGLAGGSGGGGFSGPVVAVIPVTQGWGGLAWQGWRKLSAKVFA